MRSRSGMVLVYIVPVVTGGLSVLQSDSDTREMSGTEPQPPKEAPMET